MLLGFIFAGATALSLIFIVAPTANNLIILASATNYRSRHHRKALEILRVAHIKDGDEEYLKSRNFGTLLIGIILMVILSVWSYTSLKGYFLS